MNGFLQTAWQMINSPIGITIMGSILAFVLAKLWSHKPAWQKYGGYLVAAVRWAEKTIPDTTPNAGVARLDAAMKYFLKVYEEAEGSPLPSNHTTAVLNALSLTHNQVETNLAMKGPTITVMLLAGLLAFAGGCSPTQNEWNHRAQAGMKLNADNLTMMHDELAAAVESDKAQFVASLFADIKRARAGQITVPFDDVYLDQAQLLLGAGLQRYDARRKKVDDDYIIAMKNSGRVVEALENIQKLNSAWAGNGEMIASQISELRDMIIQMQQTRASQKRRRRRREDVSKQAPMEQIADAVKVSLDQLQAAFPSAVAKLMADFGDDAAWSMTLAASLAEADPGLLQRTQDETSFAGVLKIVIPLVTQTLMKFL